MADYIERPSPETANDIAVDREFGSFVIVWLGQLISMVGSGLTAFTLGLWVYTTTGSVTRFALISFFGMAPSIICLPLAGALVDRWDRRTAMLLSDSGAACCTLSVALLLWSGRLEIWHIYIAVALASGFASFRWPAFSASIPLMVPMRHLYRANGMVQAAEASVAIASPVLAGLLIAAVKPHGILLIDFGSFMFGLAAVLLVRFPKPRKDIENPTQSRSLLREAMFGWTYITSRPGLFGLLVFFSVINFLLFGIGQQMVTPLILSLAGTKELGFALGAAGFGLLAGGIAGSIWGGPRSKVRGILTLTAVQGLFASIAGVTVEFLVVTSSLVVLSVLTPIIAACNQSIWQRKVEPEVQGRVFAVRRMMGWSSFPLAYLAAGPLADFVFEPLLAEGGLLSSTVGRVIGFGKGRGVGLLFIIVGAMTITAAVAAFRFPRIKRLEDELPDRLVSKESAVS